jgi:hypothetical protein
MSFLESEDLHRSIVEQFVKPFSKDEFNTFLLSQQNHLHSIFYYISVYALQTKRADYYEVLLKHKKKILKYDAGFEHALKSICHLNCNSCRGDSLYRDSRLILRIFFHLQRIIPIQFYKQIVDTYFKSTDVFCVKYIIKSLVLSHRTFFRKDKVLPQYLVAFRTCGLISRAIHKNDFDFVRLLLDTQPDYFSLDHLRESDFTIKFFQNVRHDLLEPVLTANDGAFLKSRFALTLKCIRYSIESNDCALLMMILRILPNFPITYNSNEFLSQSIQNQNFCLSHFLFFHRNQKYFDIITLDTSKIEYTVRRAFSANFRHFCETVLEEHHTKLKQWKFARQIIHAWLVVSFNIPSVIALQIIRFIEPAKLKKNE